MRTSSRPPAALIGLAGQDPKAAPYKSLLILVATATTKSSGTLCSAIA